MNFLDIYKTYTNGIGLINPTQFQENEFANFYTNQEVSLCGEIFEIDSTGKVTLHFLTKGGYNKKLFHDYISVLSVRVFTTFYLADKNFDLSTLNRKDLIEVTGTIKRLSHDHVKYPQIVKDTDDNSEILFYCTLSSARIKKLVLSG